MPAGTRIRYTLSETATVAFTVARRALGRRVGGRCRRATRRNRWAPRCVRFVRIRTFERATSAGAGSVRFSGRVMVRGRPRAPAPGRYRLSLRARDAAGNRSAAVSAPFKIVRD